MPFLITAIILGLMGSFHCAGMCGPIAISLPLQGTSILHKLWGAILYNSGKTAMYGCMGLLFGLIGQGFVLIGFQKWISVIMGITMILSVLIPVLFHKVHIRFAGSMTQHIHSKFLALLTKKSNAGILFLGMLNALLPCGLVYLAIAGSIGTGNAFSGMLFMIVFGLGTMPMLLFISILGTMLSTRVRIAIQSKFPFLIVIIGLFFILRGLTLGIPYISPSINTMNPQIHMKDSCRSTSEGISKSCCHGKK